MGAISKCISLISIILMLLIPTVSLSQSWSGIKPGIYKSELGDIIIRNDSVISEGVQYYIFHYSSSAQENLGLITLSYTSEGKKSKLIVVYKSGVPRHIMFEYKHYEGESFDVVFEELK